MFVKQTLGIKMVLENTIFSSPSRFFIRWGGCAVQTNTKSEGRSLFWLESVTSEFEVQRSGILVTVEALLNVQYVPSQVYSGRAPRLPPDPVRAPKLGRDLCGKPRFLGHGFSS